MNTFVGVRGRAAAMTGVLAIVLPLAVAAPVSATAAPHRAHIESTLATKLDQASASDTFRVVVHTSDTNADMPGHVYHRIASIDTVAARMTKAQIDAVAARADVTSVAVDGRVHATLDTARPNFGVDNAVADFGVTGDGDGAVSTFTGSDVGIAVIDTGIDTGHEKLGGGKVRHFEVFATDPDPSCNNGQPYPLGAQSAFDDFGHGTHVSSIVAGGLGGLANFQGVAPGATLVGLKVLDCTGVGSLSDVEAAMQWVIDNHNAFNIRVVNLSLGGDTNTDGTDSTSIMVNRLVANGIATFVAAGNDGPGVGSVTAPATARWGVTVGAMSDFGDVTTTNPPGFGLAPFSSRGPTADNRVKPDIVAAGVDIRAALAGTTSGYTTMSGTSMATPFAAGVAALMLQANGGLAPGGTPCTPAPTPSCPDGVIDSTMHNGLADTMRTTAVDFGQAGMDNEYGAGRLDAYAAVRAAVGHAAGGGPPVVPNHVTLNSSLSGPGDCDAWRVNVTATTQPLAATMIMPSWAGASSPNFTLEVRDAGGVVVRSSAGSTRQELLGFRPTSTGTFFVRVFSVMGSGPFYFDLSGGSLVSSTPEACASLVYAGSPHVVEANTTSDTYTIKLNTAPTATVTVALSHDAFETVNPSSLSFTTGNWSTPQTVTVTAVNDNIASGTQHNGLVSAALSSTDPLFNGAPVPPKAVLIDDNDAAGIDLSRTSVNVNEGGPTSDTYTIALHSQPIAAVNLQLSSADGQTTVSPSSLQFTTSNWQTPRTVTVTAVDDPFTEDSPHFGVVHGAATSTDPVYVAIGVPDVVATIADNDAHGLRGNGYRMVARDGGIFTFGNASFNGSTGGQHLNAPIVGSATTPSGGGYWLVASDGGIFAFGDAGFFGSAGGIHLNKPIVGMAATRTGRGYWLVASDGGIFAFGDAAFLGSTGALHLNKPIVGMTATPSSIGYWLVASDGGIFSFGDAGFFGSTGSLRLNAPIIAMAPTNTGGGYWLLASDGGIFSFGNAAFFGSTGSLHLNKPVVGFAPTPLARGYWLVASDGGIFSFGDAAFFGSTGSIQLNQPIIGMAV